MLVLVAAESRWPTGHFRIEWLARTRSCGVVVGYPTVFRMGDPKIFRRFLTRFAIDRCSCGIGRAVALALFVIAHGAIGWEGAAYGASAGRTSNVVFILADELRPDGLHALGNADNIIRFIQARAGKPLFVYMASNEPHDPQFAPAEHYAMYRPADIPLGHSEEILAKAIAGTRDRPIVATKCERCWDKDLAGA